MEVQLRNPFYPVAIIIYLLDTDNESAWTSKLHNGLEEMFPLNDFTRRWTQRTIDHLYERNILEREEIGKFGNSTRYAYFLKEEIDTLSRLITEYWQTSIYVCESLYTDAVIDKHLIPYLEKNLEFNLSPEFHDLFKTIVPSSRTALRALLSPGFFVDNANDDENRDEVISNRLMSLVLSSVVVDINHSRLREGILERVAIIMGKRGVTINLTTHMSLTLGKKVVEYNLQNIVTDH